MSDSTPEPRSVIRLVTSEEREEAVRRLTAAFADDAIPVDEFERRVARVYRVETPRALRQITSDLPSPPTAGSTTPAPVDRSAAVLRSPSQRFTAVLGSTERTLRGPVPERLDVRSVMGSVELDLRRAEFPPGVTEIRVHSVMGSIEIELPSHVRVENEGQAFLAHVSVKGRTQGRGDTATPVVRITGRAIFANVEIELD